MSQIAEDLLIIYETEAEQWATYLRSVFIGPIKESGICCYDIATVSSRRDDFLRLVHYRCKLLILSRGMLEGLCQLRRFFLARVLCPATHVVVLLCGVESLAPLLEMVPLKGHECLQISSEQDAHEYLSAVNDIIRKGGSSSAENVSVSPSRSLGPKQMPDQTPPERSPSGKPSVVVVPSKVPCGSSTEVFILLKDKVASSDAEVEFSIDNQRVTVKPDQWNERVLCVSAPDLPAGNVTLTLYCSGAALSEAQLHYYSTMEEITRLLTMVANPVDFMCQAFQVTSVEELDQKLSSILVKAMPSGGFQGLQCDNAPEKVQQPEEVPSLLHFAAQNGLKNVSSLLLQCPGAKRALCTTNHHGQTPSDIAESHGHIELHILLKETLSVFNSGEDSGDAGVYELMCTAGSTIALDVQREEQGESEADEDPYAPLGVNDEDYDTILTSSNTVTIANRPPAPTPRPETTPAKEDRTPFIAQVFQKKTPQGDNDTLYSLPTKQAHGRGDSISSTYDTFVPNQPPGLDQLIELQEGVKRGSLTMDEALERFSDWQRVQKGMDGIQQEKLRQLRASIIKKSDADNGVYDKINIVHHTPNITVNECRRGSRQSESDFYSKPLKGQQQQAHFFWKGDKQ
ncbi:B-cell scaffold protein with ankyrin repeats-like [Lampris incognitus]|uniref:B-cell scaffold protein with ankyrin repeats-like n=1 Tax=Lampris incognitus TaxID=2546036 RepID=UPI0024B59806|nr:B-cell scaffold protein with ankyrin repeats-like [Lampris incognitus]